jgi:curved DNA-binding protein CbpA
MADPLEQLDYYTLLQVPRGATVDAVRRAFHQFAAKYHPDRFQGAGAEPEKVERATQIYRRGAEAYRILTDPMRRKQYDAGLDQGRVRFDPAAPPPEQPAEVGKWPIKVKSPIARPFAMKAEQAYKAADWGNAKVNLKLALGRDKGNAQIEALLKDVDIKLGHGVSEQEVAQAAPEPAAPQPSSGFDSEPPTGLIQKKL